MNRKQFIKRALLGSVGVAVAPQVVAEVTAKPDVKVLGPFKIKMSQDDKLYHPPTLAYFKSRRWKDGELWAWRSEIRQWCRVEVQTGTFKDPNWVNPEPWMYESLDGFHSERFVTKSGIASKPTTFYMAHWRSIWPDELLVNKS